MAENNTGAGKKEGMQTRLLPKNYRQIGEPGAKKIYIEDYVYTYLSKIAQPGNLYSRGAILFGKSYQTAAGTCLFISGAMSCQSIEFDLEETVFSEDTWNEIYQVRDNWFPDLEISGWFLSRMGFSVELNDKIIRMHMDNFNGENKVLYMMDILENEDAFYQLENYSLRKQKGYYIYYESNPQMADFMLAEGQGEQTEQAINKSSEMRRDSAVVRNYKNTIQKNKNKEQPKRHFKSPAMAAGVAILAVALLYGLYTINVFRNNQQTKTVFIQSDSALEDNNLLSDSSSENVSEEYTTEYSDTETISADVENTAGKEENSTDTEENTETMLSETGTTKEDTDVFTQEDPDEAVESWAYIGGEYTVKSGDTLASISKEIYDSYDYIQKIADENNIENINQIYPGQVLKIPLIND